MRRVIFRELILLALALALAASGAEAYLRAFDPQDLMTPAYTERMGIAAWLPGVTIREKTRYFDASYTTNDLGLRGISRPEAKPRGVERILALGGSFTFGTGVNDEETYARLLEDRLNAASPKTHYEVLNFGWGGTPMNFQELFYRTVGSRYAPDVLLLHVHFIGVDKLFATDVSRLDAAPPSSSGSRLGSFKTRLRSLPGYTFLCENSHLWALKRKGLAAQAAPGAAAQASRARASQDELQREYVKTFDGLVDAACKAKTRVLAMKDRQALASFPLIDAYMKRKEKEGPCFKVLDLDIEPRHIFSPEERHWNRDGHAFVADKVFHAL